MFNGYRWFGVKDGDARAYAIMRNHYTFHDYKDGRRQDLSYRNRHLFAGPGEKLVLMTLDCRALFVWRKFQDDSGQEGVNCAVFRNEGPCRSSDLIREAVQLAWQVWPGERLYTYVDPKKIRGDIPGYCFIRAGWKKLRHKEGVKQGQPILTKVNELLIFEKKPVQTKRNQGQTAIKK